MLATAWDLDASIVQLNHGSFGACPREVLEAQRALRAQMEAEPTRFFDRELPPLLQGARDELAHFLGSRPEEVVFVPNATTGVNAVLRSLSFQPGDELLTTNHAYNACRNALDFVAERSGARVVTAEIPFPVSSAAAVVDCLLAKVTKHTRLALLDHVTSPTALVLPMAKLVEALAARGVDTLVDGAHAPGMVELDLTRLGAAYYTGNLHKWACAPKGAAFLHVRADRQEQIRPVTISHGANRRSPGKSRFQAEFDWVGTLDMTSYLAVPVALRFMASLVPGGWAQLRERNRALALAGRTVLCERLGLEAPCPAEMIGSMASVPLPDAASVPTEPWQNDPLQELLYTQHRIEVPIATWPRPPARQVRISAQLYNDIGQYRQLADCLAVALSAERHSNKERAGASNVDAGERLR